MVCRTDQIVQNVKAFPVLTFKLTMIIVVLVTLLARMRSPACRESVLAPVLRLIRVTEDGESTLSDNQKC